MGFFDNYKDVGGGNFIGKDEKEELIKAQYPFPILKVAKGMSQFGERYVVTTEIEGEERVLGFGAGSVQSRDRMLDAVAEYLETEGAEPPIVVLRRIKRSIVLADPASAVSE